MKIVVLILLVTICRPALGIAQQPGSDSLVTNDSLQSEKINFTVMPFLSYNRTLKFMIGAIPMVMYKLEKTDTISPKSLSGLAAVYTTNDSYFISFFNRLFFNEDRWRITLFAVTGDHNSQFYLDGLDDPGFFEFQTATTIISTGIQRKVQEKVYLGLTYTHSYFYTEFQDDIRPPEKTETNGLELTSLYDTRNEVYYPTEGIQARLKWLTIPEWFGNEIEANKIKSEYNQYFAFRENNDVLAARFSGIFGLGEIAFQQQETIGGKDIRGYTEGKYRGDGLMSIQGEYRYNFHSKLGLVGFAGVATIYGSTSPSFDWKLYPGAGIGFRYKAFEDVNFNIGLDAAIGKEDWGIYFRIGEAF